MNYDDSLENRQNPTLKARHPQAQPKQPFQRSIVWSQSVQNGPDARSAPQTRISVTGRARANFRRRHRRCPCAPDSNPGKRPGGRHVAQKALL
jgi:hypothetical protein